MAACSLTNNERPCHNGSGAEHYAAYTGSRGRVRWMPRLKCKKPVVSHRLFRYHEALSYDFSLGQYE